MGGRDKEIFGEQKTMFSSDPAAMSQERQVRKI